MLRYFWCWLRRHEFYEIQRFTGHSGRIGCETCKNITWAYNTQMECVIKWDDDARELYESLGNTILEPKH